VVALGLAIAPGAQADSSSGSWTSVAPMSTPRLGAVAATLPDGDVLVAGGEDVSGNPLSSAEIYDPATNSWAPTASMSTSRLYATAVELSDGDVLVAGGLDASSNALASVELFDPNSDTWTPMAPMPVARWMATGVSLAGGGFEIAGGQGAGDDGATAVSYDDGEWGHYDFGPADIVGAAMAPDDDSYSVVELGGEDTTTGEVVSSAESVRPNGVLTMSGLPSMTDPRYLATAAAMPGDQVLVAGGATSTTGTPARDSAALYDEGTDTWSDAATMPSAVYGAVSAVLPGGRVLVAGGSDGSRPTDSAEIFAGSTLPQPQLAPVSLNDDSGGFCSCGTTDGAYVHVGDQLEAEAMSVGASASEQFQWQRCTTKCVDIPNPLNPWGSGDAYNVTPADIGASIRVVVTASTSYASVSETSKAFGPVQPLGFHLGQVWDMPPLMLEPHSFGMPIPVIRDNSSGPGSVQYVVWTPRVGSVPSAVLQRGSLTFASGQPETDIELSYLDHGVPILYPELTVTLSASSPLAITAPAQATVPISSAPLADYIRDPANPLALRTMPPISNPLAGANLFVDRTGTAVSKAAAALMATNPSDAKMLDEIVDEPDVTRFGTWNGNYPGQAVQSFLQSAQQQEPGSIPMLATYKVVNSALTHPECGHWADPPATQAEYQEWITNLAEGIGARPAVLFLEMDSLITVGCLSKEGLTIRLRELNDAINVLRDDPHLVVYLDAGAADALTARHAASLLEQAGIAKIQGFFLNSTHFDWTSREIKYGEEISRLTGGKHFVINTAENGQGPLVPKDRAKSGNEVLCNPPGRGLGPQPTTDTGYKNLDAFAWIANPGVSGGVCGAGQPPGGRFSVALALGLVRHADFKVR
jgi:endoglucanase